MLEERIDLKVDRNILDPFFDGYKYSVESPSFDSTRIPGNVSIVSRGSDMFSLQHMKMFGDVNYLTIDEFSSNDETQFLYTFANNHIVEILYQNATDSNNFTNVAEYPLGAQGAYPPSIIFVQNNFAIVCNGLDDITVFLTKTDRNEWINYTSFQPCPEPGISMVDAKFIDDRLHVLCKRIFDEAEKGTKKPEYLTQLIWTVLAPSAIGEFAVEKTTNVYQRGLFETGSITNNGSIITIATKKPSFSLEEKSEDIDSHVFSKSWTQTGRKIEISITLPADVTRTSVNLKLTAKSVFLTIGDHILMEGSFDNSIDPEDYSYDVADRLLSITLTAADDTKWTKLLEADVVGSDKKSILGDVASDIIGETAEECDESEPVLSIYWLNESSVVRQCDASGHQVLFTRRDGHQSSVCLRHDVDGLIWSLKDPAPVHTNTLNAFGYVQSSKTHRLWSGCSPDRSYACIVDSNHIFVYWQSVAVAGDLVNRKSSSRVTHIAKQQVLKLDSSESIVGVVPTNKKMFILTTDRIHVAKMSKP